MALTRLQRRRRRKRRGWRKRRQQQASSRAGAVLLTSAQLEVDQQLDSASKRLITLGVLVAVFTLINIVLYRMVERHIFYNTGEKSCACPGKEAHTGNGSSQNSAVSLLKPTWCRHPVPVSQSDPEYSKGAVSLPGVGKSCACARREAGTEDSSTWTDALPYLRPTLCLRSELLTLDEDTAHGALTLSEEGRRVSETGRWQRPPDNPKRFTRPRCVLGKEGFTSGRHYWELQLLRDRGWAVGVARESVSRNGGFTESPEGGVWAVDGVNGLHLPLTSPLSPRQRPLKLGVFLDYEGGLLSLYNADTLEELLTLSDATFTGRVWPYFWLWETDLRLV